MSDWYQLEVEAALRELNSSSELGLSSAEAAARLEKFGPNELVEKGAKSPLAIFADQFKDLSLIHI